MAPINYDINLARLPRDVQLAQKIQANKKIANLATLKLKPFEE